MAAVDRKALSAGARAASRGSSVARFVREVVAELKKVAWPDRQEIVKLTAVVLIAIATFAVYIFVLDLVFGWVTRPLTGGGSKGLTG
jgi:preprotein translocase subunit SecE